MTDPMVRFTRRCAPMLLAVAIALAPFCQTQAKLFRSAGESNGSFQHREIEHDYLSDVAADGLYCWSMDKLPVKVFFQPAEGVEGYRSSYPKILADCFDEWVQASVGKLGWTEVSHATEADIIVRWTAQASERGQGTEAGRTKTFAQLNTLTNRGTIHGAEMTLLTRLPEREFSESEVKRAYLHEVGHAFGIAGHSSEPADIMFFAVRKNQSPHLSERDVATINHLYDGYRTRTSVVSHKERRRAAQSG
jgi:predicted Zn-dependent protease